LQPVHEDDVAEVFALASPGQASVGPSTWRAAATPAALEDLLDRYRKALPLTR
jgi:hypothetical protein